MWPRECHLQSPGISHAHGTPGARPAVHFMHSPHSLEKSKEGRVWAPVRPTMSSSLCAVLFGEKTARPATTSMTPSRGAPPVLGGILKRAVPRGPQTPVLEQEISTSLTARLLRSELQSRSVSHLTSWRTHRQRRFHSTHHRKTQQLPK